MPANGPVWTRLPKTRNACPLTPRIARSTRNCISSMLGSPSASFRLLLEPPCNLLPHPLGNLRILFDEPIPEIRVCHRHVSRLRHQLGTLEQPLVVALAAVVKVV